MTNRQSSFNSCLLLLTPVNSPKKDKKITNIVTQTYYGSKVKTSGR